MLIKIKKAILIFLAIFVGNVPAEIADGSAASAEVVTSHESRAPAHYRARGQNRRTRKYYRKARKRRHIHRRIHRHRSTQGRVCYQCSRKNNSFQAAPFAEILGRTYSKNKGRYPILGTFTPAFNNCAPGCNYESWGIMGDARHQRRRSCHNTGSAIDVPGIRCQGARYGVTSARFQSFLSCMRGQNNIHVIYGNREHRGHAHISLRSCEVGGRGKVRTR